ADLRPLSDAPGKERHSPDGLNYKQWMKFALFVVNAVRHVVVLSQRHSRLTELLSPFQMKIIACRRFPRGDEGVPVITVGQLEETLRSQVDHVINILPDSSETQGFFDTARFRAMKPGTVFYNIGRGATVDQTALLDSLRSGRLASTWLDVTDPEPLPEDHPLWTEPNCFMTPHVAGGFAEEKRALVQHFLNNLNRFLKDAELVDRIV
ncbi:MAG: hypothetical protein KJ626_09975, partial [Verrucomicrobia bacterium]|nr:hypothetical protein [Verrucomicrobiota bacterium]